jgi:hypothetical protein
MAKEEKTIEKKEETKQEVKPVAFTSLAFKDSVVVKNSNKAEQVMTKRAWEEIRKAELDRLQGFELLGKYVKDDSEKGYSIQPIDDDYEPTEEA